MDTKIIKVNPETVDKNLLKDAGDIIRRGGLVAFPTETVYGLGADAFNPEAVKSIFAAKGRPCDNPLIAHIATIGDVEMLVREFPQKAISLAQAFWGGPLTMIMKKRSSVPDVVTASLDTVAVRLPSHSVANALITESKTPIAAPSANISGKPSPTVAEHVICDMQGKIDMIIDGGKSMIGLESTVIDMTQDVPTILRPGGISLEEIREVIGDAEYGGFSSDAPKCPGMKYTHYSPDAEVILYEDFKNIDTKGFKKPCLITFNAEKDERFPLMYSAGESKEEYGARLFYLLRKADLDGADAVFAVLPDKNGIGEAIRNRLLKSAGGKII